MIQDIKYKLSDENNGSDVCLLSYVLVGDSALDITNGAGYIHNNLVKFVEAKGKSKVGDYVVDNDKWLSLADSLGWTKAYRYGIVKKYMDALIEYFNYDEYKLEAFYRKNTAYEDFPDIINLCWENTAISGCSRPTHAYRKIKSSITASPRLRDFSCKRPAYLSLLLGLSKRNDVTDEGRQTIARFVILKSILIENILAKFRNDGVKFKLFRYFAKRRYFFKHFVSRLTLDGNIADFAAILKQMELYSDDNNYKITGVNPDNVIGTAAIREVKLGYVDVQQCIRENVISGNKPLNRYSKRLVVSIITCLLLILSVAICSILISQTVTDKEVLIAVSGAIISAIIAYFGNQSSGYFLKVDQDDATRRMYRNELNDMIRHLYANLNILLQIQREMDKSNNVIPAEIHFINLRIPQNSILLSDEPMKNIMINELDTIARIKVNIRNINNSADYLCELVRAPKDFDKTLFSDTLSWEITRYVGYILNLLYVADDPSFRFPQTKEQLDRFINIKGVFQSAVKEINGINPSRTKEKYDQSEIDSIVKTLKDYYTKYKNDREIQRSIVFIKK